MPAEVTGAERHTLRSPWLVFGWLVGLLVLLPAVSGFSVAEDLGSAVFVGVIMGVPGLWVSLRVPFMRVTLSSGSIVYHGFWRNRTISRDSVAGVSVEPADGTIGTAFAPSLTLRDGSVVELTLLAGYGSAPGVDGSRVGRQARLVEAYLAAPSRDRTA